METNTANHAEVEFKILAETTPDALILPFEKEILALCEAFGKSGQSGGSAPYTAVAISSAVKKLCLQKTIAPLTGGDSEFYECGDGSYQNCRDSAVFKRNSRAYYLDAIVWKGEDDWDTFTGSVEDVFSRQYIKSFPFTPKTFYIDVRRELFDETKHDKKDAVSCGTGDYVYFIKDKKQLDAVFEYYDRYTPLITLDN